LRTLRRPRSAETMPDAGRPGRGRLQAISGRRKLRRPGPAAGEYREATSVRAEPARGGGRRDARPVLPLRPDSGRKRGQHTARYLFKDWPGVSRRLRAAPCVALFTDFDGTLVPIQPRANRVRLPQAGRRLLARLVRHPRIRLWIVSARKLADLRRRTGGVGVRLAGLHGWEREDARPPAVAGREALRQAAKRLRERLRGLRGIWMEDKEWTLAIHYRGAGEAAVRRARAALREVLRPLAPALRPMLGKKVWEVIPREMESRGKAVRNLLAEGSPDSLPVYIGDDFSDESAFRALRWGITVHVGTNRMTCARYYLRSPQEVMIFLERIEREIS